MSQDSSLPIRLIFIFGMKGFPFLFQKKKKRKKKDKLLNASIELSLTFIVAQFLVWNSHSQLSSSCYSSIKKKLNSICCRVANLGGECSQLLRTGLLLHNRYRTDSEDSPISVDDESASDHEVGFYGGANSLFSLVSKSLFQYACAGQRSEVETCWPMHKGAINYR